MYTFIYIPLILVYDRNTTRYICNTYGFGTLSTLEENMILVLENVSVLNVAFTGTHSYTQHV